MMLAYTQEGSEVDELCEFERARKRNIQKNKAVLEFMGLVRL